MRSNNSKAKRFTIFNLPIKSVIVSMVEALPTYFIEEIDLNVYMTGTIKKSNKEGIL